MRNILCIFDLRVHTSRNTTSKYDFITVKQTESSFGMSYEILALRSQNGVRLVGESQKRNPLTY